MSSTLSCCDLDLTLLTCRTAGLAGGESRGAGGREQLNVAKFLFPDCPKSFWEERGARMGEQQISVVVPSHNHAPFVVTALLSVNESARYLWERRCKDGGRCLPVEVLVVDDASTDETSRKVAEFQQRCQLNSSR